MEAVNKINYKLRDVSTRSVTLFPSRAQVTREIKDVALQAGTNKITIVGLTPTIDKDSIKVEGSGIAVITDIAVTEEPNQEVFEEVYPEFDFVDVPDVPESEESSYDELLAEKDSPELTAAREEQARLKDELEAAEETMLSACERLKVLDTFSNNLPRKNVKISIEEQLEIYGQERDKAFKARAAGQKTKRELTEAIKVAELKVSKFVARQEHERLKQQDERLKAEHERQKEKHKEDIRKFQEKDRLKRRRDELEYTWPKYVYSVCITLEATPYTPMSSRRSSVASEVELAKAPTTTETEIAGPAPAPCDLLLTYVTSFADWVPSYDLQLSTTTAKGTLLFDAQLHNSTSETWENCKVILSTSQTTSTNLEETTPTLDPWHIRLAKTDEKPSNTNIARSRAEVTQSASFSRTMRGGISQKARHTMFVGTVGNDEYTLKRQREMHQEELMQIEQNNKQKLAAARQEHQSKQAQRRRKAAAAAAPPPPIASSLFGAAPAVAGGLFGSRAAGGSGGGLFGGASAFGAPAQARRAVAETTEEEVIDYSDEDMGFGLFDGPNSPQYSPSSPPPLDYQESSFEETGMTTTYELPGLKTLLPSATTSKHRIARIGFTNIAFSRTIAPKYKPVAHLKAKIRNSSKLTLLKGPMGLTLDNTFMGRTTLPRCSSGGNFDLSLGTDPEIRVTYPAPVVRRATTGMFSKEDSALYARSITLESTRSSGDKPLEIMVYDQIPVSEDERLKVEIQTPVGITPGGSAVRAGTNAGEEKDKDWGKSIATTKKNGLVTWEVRLNPGKAVRLGLEYIVAMPGGSVAVQV